MPVLLDNQQASIANHLRDHLKTADIFRLVTAYFSIYGYEALAEQLDKAGLQVRFLFGAPESAGSIGAGEKPARFYCLGQDGNLLLAPGGHILGQRDIARRCAAWVRKNSVQIRSLTETNFLHGKMYHLQGGKGGGIRQSVTVGSSNFTRRGLGASANPNLEINLASGDPATCRETEQWFDRLWNDGNRVEDVKQQVLAELERLYENTAPEHIYYKTLYELFKKELEARRREENNLENTTLYESKIWRILYEFQKDGALSAIGRLLRYNGCILADSVGLGKTFTALAVIKYFELRNERVLVLCPKKLENNWRTYQASAARADNPLADDRFSFDVLAHTDLSRESGMAGNIDLANFNWSSYSLVVIDESHNFRNAGKITRDEQGNITRMSRHRRLLKQVIEAGVNTKTLLLSATPVNTSLIDLHNQINLMTGGRDNAFQDSLGIRAVSTTIKAAQKKFQRWETGTSSSKNKDTLLDSLGGEFLHLLGSVSIARSRKQIQHFYQNFIREKGDFPERKLQNEHPETDNQGALSYQQLNRQISEVKFDIYRPSSYIVDPTLAKQLEDEKEKLNFNQKTREGFLVDMMRINFLKRLESSAHALKLTLERTIGKIDQTTAKIDKYRQQQTTRPDDTRIDISPDDDPDDEEFIISRQAVNPYHLHELDTETWRKAIQQDRETLQAILDRVKQITPERDAKLDKLKAQLKEKSAQPNRKLLVFTAFKDTAEYLYQQIQTTAAELGLTVGMVAGDTARTTLPGGREDFNAVLSDFAPKARNRSDSGSGDSDNKNKGEIDLLIATDCISEGQNLQDCDSVLNYDIHWNPVRLIQRFGRIDRIGSANPVVTMINYWPTRDMDLYLKLETRVQARMALADATATGDDNYLDTDSVKGPIQQELAFRSKQTKQLQEEIIDIDNQPDSLSMNDLTLDYFLTQLLRYIQENEELLKKIPAGALAVTDCADSRNLFAQDIQPPGAIFFIHQPVAAEKNADNPIHPFYLVQTAKNEVRRSYKSARQILTLLEALTIDKKEAITDLCDAFDEEISTEAGKEYYNTMAQEAIKAIQSGTTAGTSKTLTSDRAAVIPTSKEKPQIGNLELITWVALKNR